MSLAVLALGSFGRSAFEKEFHEGKFEHLGDAIKHSAKDRSRFKPPFQPFDAVIGARSRPRPEQSFIDGYNVRYINMLLITSQIGAAPN
jgi:hypothetical protein